MTKKDIEEKHERKLTNRQMTFARHIVEGIYSNAESARQAGYSPELANERASVLLNGRDYPHVVEHIEELRQERERRYGVTTIGQRETASIVSRGRRGWAFFSSHQRRENKICIGWIDHR